MKSLLGFLGVCLTACALAVVAEPAAAATGHGTVVTGSCSSGPIQTRAYMRFVAKTYDNGSVTVVRSWDVKDTCTDGRSAIGQWKLGSASSTKPVKTYWNTKGSMRAISGDPGSTGTSKVSFRVCTGQYATRTLQQCSSWKTIS